MIDLIHTLSKEHRRVRPLCKLFGIHSSSYYYRIKHKDRVNPERERLKQQTIAIHTASRGAAGARTIAGQLTQQGEKVGRHKARNLMQEAMIHSKQPRRHKYKIADQQSRIAENILQRQFNVEAPDKVWCGDVTYVWSGTQWLWHTWPRRSERSCLTPCSLQPASVPSRSASACPSHLAARSWPSCPKH